MTLELQSMSLSELRHGRSINDSHFLKLYGELVVDGTLDREELVYLLSRAILFLRADDTNLNKFGYRIVLQYSLRTGDYQPLYEVAAVKEYAPILEAIEETTEISFQSALLTTLNASNRINFTISDGRSSTVRTRGQLELRAFANSASFGVVVAPTSYGKSEMMRERIHARLGENSAIMVPTKSLISQTRTQLVRDPIVQDSTLRVITHPDAYVPGKPFVAVMTQERIFRLLRENPKLQLSQLLIDEAHNLLSNDRRAEQASEVVLALLHRKPEMNVMYYTPFMANPNALVHVNAQRELAHKESREHVKIERYYFTDMSKRALYLFDQFLRRSFLVSETLVDSEEGFILAFAGRKNLVYVNRPRNAELVAVKLASRNGASSNDDLQEALRAIAEHVHPKYQLIECLQHGVAFHHGGMPEMIRLYVEELFSSAAHGTPTLLVSTSTLLEGVNTPADTLFVLNPSKGPRHLSASQFRNLAGRVGRFKEIFSSDETRLDLLQPRIFVVDGDSAGARFAPETFLRRVADVVTDASEPASNPLLEEGADSERRAELLERLENLEPGSSGLSVPRLLGTNVGREALAHGVDDYDLFENEVELQARIDEWSEVRGRIKTSGELVEAISEIFLVGLPLDEKRSANLSRLVDNSSARSFYSMFIDWRAQAMSLREMVAREIAFFRRQAGALVFVGPTWGDRTLGDGWQKYWMDPADKSETELATLAVAKVKEEQDFIDFFLMRYVETLRALDLIEDSLYYRVKYGTDDKDLILFIQTGVSLELAKLLLERYAKYVEVNRDDGVVIVSPGVSEAMRLSNENEILVFEASRLS